VLVDRGDRVKRGQVVAVVRPSDLPDQLAAARAAAAQSRASAQLARANKERAKLLAPSGRISQQELQQSEAALAAAEAQEASARGGGSTWTAFRGARISARWFASPPRSTRSPGRSRPRCRSPIRPASCARACTVGHRS